jgi:hypothetical protein
MSISLIRVATFGAPLTGIEEQYEKEFRYLYKWVDQVWKQDKTSIIHMMKTVNFMLIGITDRIPVGFLFGNIFKHRYDNSLVENFLQSAPGDPIKRISNFLPMLKQRSGNYEDHPYFSKLRHFITNPTLKGKGIGSTLFESFQKNCGNEYQQWMSDDKSDWMWYIRKGCTIVGAGDASDMGDPGHEFRCIYIHSKDPSKQKQIQLANCFMTFPKEEIGQYKTRLKKGSIAYTLRVSDEKDKYVVGYRYVTPWGKFIEVVDKKIITDITEFSFVDELNTDQINEIRKYQKEGIAVYTFKYAL